MLLALVFRASIPAPKLRCFPLCIETVVILGARAGNRGLLHQERTKRDLWLHGSSDCLSLQVRKPKISNFLALLP